MNRSVSVPPIMIIPGWLPFLVLIHLLICGGLLNRTSSWRRRHPGGADGYRRFLPYLILAGLTGYSLMLIGMMFCPAPPSLREIFSGDADAAIRQIKRGTAILATLFPALPLFGLVRSIGSKVNLVALFASVSAFASIPAVLGILF